jgi:hypothetical protein
MRADPAGGGGGEDGEAAAEETEVNLVVVKG